MFGGAIISHSPIFTSGFLAFTIDIISDNKDYPTMSASPHEVDIIGSVVGRFGGIE